MCDLLENIQHFHIGWKILFSFFAQDDLLYLLKMNVLFKFYRRQTFFVKGICQPNHNQLQKAKRENLFFRKVYT